MDEMAMSLFDSHAHLTDSVFQDDLEAVLDRAAAAGVHRIVSIASDVEDSGRTIALAEAYPERILATAGVHPHEAGSAGPDAILQIRDLAEGSSSVVAVGEMGLDYHYEHSPRKVQRDVFVGQMEMAESLGLPVVVHSRSALEDTLSIIRDAGSGVRGVLHCFTGELELLEGALEAGWWVSYTGIVTFRNWGGMDAVRATPADRFMVETDSPWLSPAPDRGRRNEPARVQRVVEALAEARGESIEQVAEQTTRNAHVCFGVE